MSKHTYYYYDPEACTYVPYAPKPVRKYGLYIGGAFAILLLAYVMNLGIDRLDKTGEEIALIQENETLREQYTLLQDRVTALSHQVNTLETQDEDLYRKVLQADPIPEEVRQVGVGGSDPFAQFDGLSPASAQLLRETSVQIEQLTNQVNLQNQSYRELSSLAEEKEQWLRELPAILPSDGPVVSGYGMRDHPILGVRRMHYGLDILVNTGTAVVSTGDGVILKRANSSSWGKYIQVRHPSTGYVTLYAHLSEIPRHIQRGRTVKRGELIGYSGNTGLSKSPHLHYEVHDAQNRALNPIFFFAPSMTPSAYKQLVAEASKAGSSFD